MKTIIPALFAICFLASCSHKIYSSLDWQGTKVTADGRITEWPDPLRYLDDKTKISYSISNDARNLYVCMRVADPRLKTKIIRSGMEFKIDTLGKKSFPVRFMFPLENQIVMAQDRYGEPRTDDNHGSKPARPARVPKIVSPANEFQVVGFRHLHDGMFSLLKNTSGISAAVNIDSLGSVCYEAVIPFSTFYKDHLTSEDTSRVFTYEFVINPLPAPATHSGDSGEGGMESGGAGGLNGGGGHHGGGGMNGGGHQGGAGPGSANGEMYSPNQITKKMKFSLKPF